MFVSVVMITYNHSPYIKQAIESILSQVTDFDFELIISNDNSTDNTDAIIKETLANNPNGHKAKYFNNETNLGMMPNSISALNKATGKYIALCEGDDYWCDDQKLSLQVEFLESNPDFSICFHNVYLLSDTELKEDNRKKKIPEVTTIKDLAKNNYIHTPSVVYRNNLFKELPKYFSETPVGDYFLHMLNAQFGKIKYMDKIMSVYRVHNTSYWSSKKDAEQRIIMINFLNTLKTYFDTDVQKILNRQILKIKRKDMSFFQKLASKIKTVF
ncbi:glycosyltransferase [Flavobacterium sp. LS1R49]|uniref:Glycosyltransferase n=1 Tax=Flavobacterium shii TaxID=2987687 RepID=A0A9X2ZAS9_9FLAO|nr:glycosyltransferase [Flavobacterium shii]MCV9926870.1 glycosyltransferase [Flavobacterium shii]